jgi:hypothetical protein
MAKGKHPWLWMATTPMGTVFSIAPDREVGCGVSRPVTHPTRMLAARGTDLPGAPDQRSGPRKAGEVMGHLGWMCRAWARLRPSTRRTRWTAWGRGRRGAPGAHDMTASDVFKGASEGDA